VNRGTKEWQDMLEGTSAPLAGIKRAKADERNARERLFRACRRNMKEAGG